MITRIYTDGAATGNGTKCCNASWSVVKIDCVKLEEGQIMEYKHDGNKYLQQLTTTLKDYKINVTVMSGLVDGEKSNNRAELTALLQALLTFDNAIICSDSMYAIQSVAAWYQTWLRKGVDKKNIDLISLCYEFYSTKKITLQHVKGHQKRVNTESIYTILDYYGNSLADYYCAKLLYR